MKEENLYSYSEPTDFGNKRKVKQIQKIFNNLLPRLRHSSRILEIGAGRGEFANIARNKGFEYIGVEPSDQLREKLQEDGFRILKDPLPNIQVEDESVDLVYSYDVVEHLGDYLNVLAFFSEARRILNPGGQIVVIAPNAETIGHLFYIYEYQHSFLTGLERIESLLRDAGFEILSSRKFLTDLGMSNNGAFRIIDRILAHTILLFARSVLVTALMRFVLGRSIVFRIHKNLYDHVYVIAKKLS